MVGSNYSLFPFNLKSFLFDLRAIMTTLTASPHDITLPSFSPKAASVTAHELPDPERVAQKWLSSFERALTSGKSSEVTTLIVEDGWWRDQLGLSWDYRTLRGTSKIATFLHERLAKAGLHNLQLQKSGKFKPSLQEPIEGLDWVESMFSFDSAVGSGKGMIRLVCLPKGAWKAHMIYTALQELADAKEIAGYRRPHGGNNSLRGGALEGNWLERRERQKEFLGEEPTVLIIGAGQSGLNMGARLQALGLSCLLIDKNERVGDNWRHRYRTLVTHDPVQYTHMVGQSIAS